MYALHPNYARRQSIDSEYYNIAKYSIRTMNVITLSMGLLILLLLLFFIVIPAVYIWGFVLIRKRKRLINLMQKSTDLTNLTLEDYLKIKKQSEAIAKLSDEVRRSAVYDLNKVPFLLRFPAKKNKQLNSTLLLFEKWHNGLLGKYNKEQFVSNSKVFTLKTENELWANRNKNYSYWM